MDAKVGQDDLKELMLQKANKQSVATALQRKANKSDTTALEEKLTQTHTEL